VLSGMDQVSTAGEGAAHRTRLAAYRADRPGHRGDTGRSNTHDGLRPLPGRIMSGIQFFEAQIDAQASWGATSAAIRSRWSRSQRSSTCR
jgi:hypothetical protein